MSFGASPEHILKRTLAWALPEPVTAEEASILRVGGRARVTGDPPAVIAVGRTGQKEVRLRGLDHLPARERLRLVPSSGSPRALLPDRCGRTERQTLVRARSSTLSPLRWLALIALRGVPGQVLRLVSAPLEVASATSSPLVIALRRLRPGARMGVVLNPSNYDRPAIFSFDARGRPAAVAKFASAPRDRLRQSLEWDILQALSRIPSLAGSVPRPLARVPGHLGDGIVTEAFSGAPAPPRLEPPLLDWLERCQRRGELSVGRSPLVSRLLDELQGGRDPMLLHAAQTAAACLEDVRAPVTVVHGDFVPWNIVLDNTLPRVFDWEWASLEGVPGWDAVYFPLQVGQVVERWSAPELVACVKRLADRPVHPYGGQQYRCLILLVLVHLAKVVAGTPPFALTVRQAIEHLLKAAWLSDTTPRRAS